MLRAVHCGGACRLASLTLLLLVWHTAQKALSPHSPMDIVNHDTHKPFTNEDRNIWQAVSHDKPRNIEITLESGEDINVIEKRSGQTPLMKAVLTGKEKSVTYLLERGADPHIPEKDGYTPLHAAALKGHVGITKILCDHGLDVHEMHKDGMTPLHHAVIGHTKQHTDTAAELLKCGAKWDEPTMDGRTPIQLVHTNVGTKRLLNRFVKGRVRKTATGHWDL
mmetsp:Transcript_63156/g.116508  ORF Transcript_63156/g.116508 Transcript_63156/m.116508 type:complete len:222 (+) Transcript_63156:337-1002(+)